MEKIRKTCDFNPMIVMGFSVFETHDFIACIKMCMFVNLHI